MVAKKEKAETKDPRYIVVTSQRWAMLQDLVNEKIVKGYMPVGGISAVAYKAHDGAVLYEFFQSMMRPETYTF